MKPNHASGQNDRHTRRRVCGVGVRRERAGRIEVTGLRVTVHLPRAAARVRRPPAEAPPVGEREIYLPERRAYGSVPVISRDALADAIDGPAIITQDDATTVLPARWRARAEHTGDVMVLERDN